MDSTVDVSVAVRVVWFVEVDGRYQFLEFIHWAVGSGYSLDFPRCAYVIWASNIALLLSTRHDEVEVEVETNIAESVERQSTNTSY